MHSTYSRKAHVGGALLGTAAGEALGLARTGLPAKRALRLYGRPQYQFIPGRGIYGEHTRMMLLFAQALLNSRNEMSHLRSAFRWRLSYYPLSFPPGISRSVLKSSGRCWLSRFGMDSAIECDDNLASTRAVLSGSVMVGAGHRTDRWIELSTRFTHDSPLAVDCARILACLAECAATKAKEFEPSKALERIRELSVQPEITEPLAVAADYLAAGYGPRKLLRRLDWDSVGKDAVSTTVISTYCFLRYPRDFSRAVGAAVTLGGDSDAAGAVVGGLVGSLVGKSRLPEKWTKKIACYPHHRPWFDALTSRFSHWPHGADDLYMAPAQRSDPHWQIVRNLSHMPVAVVHRLRRLRG